MYELSRFYLYIYEKIYNNNQRKGCHEFEREKGDYMGGGRGRKGKRGNNVIMISKNKKLL